MSNEMAHLESQMKYLFYPRSVAVIGASANATKFTGRTLRYLLKHGYKGRVYPVNPNYKELMGIRCYESVSELPEDVDNAFIQVPNSGLLNIAGECSRKGIRTAVIHTAGLGESSIYATVRIKKIK